MAKNTSVSCHLMLPVKVGQVVIGMSSIEVQVINAAMCLPYRVNYLAGDTVNLFLLLSAPKYANILMFDENRDD